MNKTLVFAVALIISVTSMAGQREWATAGKILTGIVAADVIFNHLPFRHREERQETIVIRQPVYYTGHYEYVTKTVWVNTSVETIQWIREYDSYTRTFIYRQVVVRTPYGYWTTITEKIWIQEPIRYSGW